MITKDILHRRNSTGGINTFIFNLYYYRAMVVKTKKKHCGTGTKIGVVITKIKVRNQMQVHTLTWALTNIFKKKKKRALQHV